MENRKLCLAYLSGIKKDTREQGGALWSGGKKKAVRPKAHRKKDKALALPHKPKN